MNRTLDWPRYSRWTLAVAVLLVLVLVVLWLARLGPLGTQACCGRPSEVAAPATTPTAPPPPSASKTPGTLTIGVDGDRRVLEGTLPDAAAKDRVLAAANAAWGAAHVVDRMRVDAATSPSICAQHPDVLFPALATEPPTGIACDANGGVTLTGTAASEADKAARARWAQEFFGPGTTIANAIGIAAAPEPVTRPEDVRCAARMPAAVTFATASSRIDAKGRALLDAIVPCLAKGHYEIAGHTDDIGSDEDNMKLSTRRAESVRAYMILKGVDAERLTAVGYGETHPIGDNTTARGRASNRRIEFVRK
jgi:OmpA-OmpF porin, OOP family